MEIDKNQLRDLLLWFVDLIYAARKDLVPYRVAHTLLGAAGLSQEFDQLLQQARKNPSPALLADHQAIKETADKSLSAVRAEVLRREPGSGRDYAEIERALAHRHYSQRAPHKYGT